VGDKIVKLLDKQVEIEQEYAGNKFIYYYYSTQLTMVKKTRYNCIDKPSSLFESEKNEYPMSENSKEPSNHDLLNSNQSRENSLKESEIL
jgi:hypothetical protein